MSDYVIALDAMGGDNAPDAIVKGAIRALRKYPDIRIILTGPEERLKLLIADSKDISDRIEILNATQIIEMDDSPMMAVRSKKDSSMVVAMNAVREGKAGAAVSAGSTGAVLACGMFKVGRIKGIERPALTPVLPTISNQFILVDSGANVDCQSKYLLQFGLMGSVYMRDVMGITDPRVGLLNIGAESEKGNKLTKETYELMAEQKIYNFVGNCEARDAFTGNYDVVVADGFDGNILLKNTEGLVKMVFKMLKDELMSGGPLVKLGVFLTRKKLKALKEKMDYNKVGGAPLLGVDGVVVKAHGASGEEAIENAIAQARKMLECNMVEKIREGLKGLSEAQ